MYIKPSYHKHNYYTNAQNEMRNYDPSASHPGHGPWESQCHGYSPCKPLVRVILGNPGYIDRARSIQCNISGRNSRRNRQRVHVHILQEITGKVKLADTWLKIRTGDQTRNMHLTITSVLRWGYKQRYSLEKNNNKTSRNTHSKLHSTI